MTAQTPDSIEYQAHRYALVGLDGGPLFEPKAHGLIPRPFTTACERGFVAYYALRAEMLRLDALELGVLGLRDDRADVQQAPTILNVRPTSTRLGTLVVYESLDLMVKFSGRLLLAEGWISKIGLNEGFQPAWKHKRVIALRLHQGRLLTEQDISQEVAGVRREILMGKRPDPDAPGTEGWIERTFRLDFERSLGGVSL